SGVALAVMSFGLYVISVAAEAPPIDELAPVSEGENSIVYASDGSRLGYIQSDEARTTIEMEKIPEDLRDATVAIEDERFYEHNGVDFEGITRAAFENISAGEVKQGGSTITMQLVRNLYIEDPERDIERKIKEAKLAEELEDKLSKEEILEQYLNSASYGTVNGRTAVGVEAASQIYFSKPAADLTLSEAAMLAGLPQSPSLYNPLQNSSGAEERRNEVLDSMAEQDYITLADADEAKSEPIALEPSNRYTEIREPYFFDFVQQQLIEEYGVNTVRQGGLKVFTTIDPVLQEAGRAAIENHLYYSDDPSAAVVSIDPNTGFVKAMASSGSYSDAKFNLAAQGHRQAGSAFKTFALTDAVRRGIDPDNTYYESKPLDIDDEEYGHWEVETYGGDYAGSIDLHSATLASDNTVFAQLALDLGPDSVADTAKDMGIETDLDGLPAETLGGLRLGVSPLEITNAYATLASGGVHNKPLAIRKVSFPDGRLDEVGEPERNRVFEDGVAYEVTQILEDNVDAGTGTAAGTGCGDEAGKTGTTDDFNDAMFIGYTPYLATGVWVGYPDALRSMSSVHGISVAGGTFPAMIWNDFMEIALDGHCEEFPEPENPVEWIPFNGEYTSDYGSSCSDSAAGTDPAGSYGGCYEPTESTDEEPSKEDKNDGAYAPGRGQKPEPKPEPEPKPTPQPPPAPPAPPPPGGGGITP
ncbi:MAG: penicillin-binding protein, partial [Actinomycetota bacterium]|nr:penicillin-binding protein [Actinomycetota bacterium]